MMHDIRHPRESVVAYQRPGVMPAPVFGQVLAITVQDVEGRGEDEADLAGSVVHVGELFVAGHVEIIACTAFRMTLPSVLTDPPLRPPWRRPPSGGSLAPRPQGHVGQPGNDVAAIYCPSPPPIRARLVLGEHFERLAGGQLVLAPGLPAIRRPH